MRGAGIRLASRTVVPTDRPMDDDTRPNAGRADGEGSREPWRQAERKRLVADIAARLRKACAHLTDDEFSKLVLEIAERRMRFDDMDPMTGRRRLRDS